MMVRCLSIESWSDAISGEACALLIGKRVPHGVRFNVYVGNILLPRLVDHKNKFVSLGCAKYGRGKYICKVGVDVGNSV